MKQSKRKKISEFFKQLASLSLVAWMSGLGFLLGVPFVVWVFELIWGQAHGYNVFGKILLTVLLVVISILYLAGTISLSRKQEEERKLYPSTIDYDVSNRYCSRCKTYEEYMVDASDKYISDYFIEHYEKGISAAIKKHLFHHSVDSLFALYLFKRSIIKDIDKYTNKPITIYCFLHQFGELSMSPFAQKNTKFYSRYGNRYIKNTDYFKKYEFYFNDFETSYSNDSFNINYESSNELDYTLFGDYYKDGYIAVHATAFVKVTGYIAISKYNDNRLILQNCKFEKANYRAYVDQLDEILNEEE